MMSTGKKFNTYNHFSKIDSVTNLLCIQLPLEVLECPFVLAYS